eukprot:1586475-Ditylum_brightwellii.AAC.1
MQFDLHVHSCKHNYRRDTQAIVFVLDQAESRSVKSKLYRLNNSTKAERKKWSHTGYWKFVPFQPEGSIKDAHIASMF